MTEALHPLVKPRMRGVSHQWAFFASLVTGAALVAAAPAGRATLAAAIYAASVAGLFGSSALYHRITWASARARSWMRRLDHSMIFLLIAGTYTPYAAIALHPPWSTTVLAVVWGGALVGVVTRLLSRGLGWLQNTLYIALGWTALFTLPLMITRLEPAAIALMFAGGLFYTIGAVLFLLRRPNPNPLVFGYHEVWHVMVTSGSLCHYAFVLWLVVR